MHFWILVTIKSIIFNRKIKKKNIIIRYDVYQALNVLQQTFFSDNKKIVPLLVLYKY